MKKNKLFLSVATLLLAVSAVSYASMLGMGAVTASSPEVSEVEEVAELNEIARVAEVAEPKIEDYKVTELDYTGNTQYLLYNVEAKGYFVGTNSWGTRASYTTTISAGYKVTISAGQGEGLYSLNDYCLAKGGGLYAVDCQGVDNIWTDGTGRAGAGMWQFTAQPDGTFLISNTNVKAAEGEKTLYLSVVPGSSENNEVIAGTSLYMSNVENAQNRWAFVSVDYLTDLEAYEKANYKAGDEVTSLAPGTWIAAQGNGPNPYSTGTETFGNPSFSAGKVLYQSIEGLKNGEYEVTLYAAANLAAWNGQTGSGAGIAQVYANTTTYDVEVIDQKDCTLSNYEYTLKATVTDGTLEYGLQNIATGGCWYVCQLVKIKYVGEAVDLSEYVKQLADAVAAAEAVSGNMNAVVKAALDKAISDNKAVSYTTADDYSAAIKSVKDATANAKASVAVYELAAEYTGKADGLDKTGKAIYAADVTVAAVAAAYNDGTLDAITDEQKSAMDAALVAAVKAQTTDGADMTLAIVNPTIINNGQNTDCPYGWTESTHTGWSWTKATGDTFFENWNGSASQVNFDFKQTITGLPNGTYKVTANMFASTNGEEGAEFTGKGYVLYGLASNEAQVSVDENNYDDPPTVFKAYTTGEVYVVDGTLTIGVKTVGTPTERWFGADNFKLTYVSSKYPGKEEPVEQIVVMKYTGESTTVMTGENDAELVNLDETDWTVIGTKENKQQNVPGLNKNKTIRLYGGTSGSSVLTVTGATYDVEKIKVFIHQEGSNNNDLLGVYVDDKAVEGEDGVYSINASEFALKNLNEETKQVWIDSVYVYYKEKAPVVEVASLGEVKVDVNAAEGNVTVTMPEYTETLDGNKFVADVTVKVGETEVVVPVTVDATEAVVLPTSTFVGDLPAGTEVNVTIPAGKLRLVNADEVTIAENKTDIEFSITVSEKKPESDVIVKMTYVDFDNPDTSYGVVDEAVIGYNKIVNGEVAFGNTAWGVNKIGYVLVDASKLKGVVKKATLKAEISGSTDSKRGTAWGVGYNSSTWSSELTYNSADKSITTCGEIVSSSQKSGAVFDEVSFDITDAFANGNMSSTIIIYETAAAGGNIKNVTAEIETGDPEISINGIIYAVKSENLFVNGSFDNGVAGWKATNYDTDAEAENFTLADEGGFDGGAFITTNAGGAGSTTAPRQAIAVESGKTYYFSCYTSGKAPTSNNFQYNALFKLNGEKTENGLLTSFEWPQGAEQTSDTWSKTEYVFTADEDIPFVGVRMSWNQGASFDGFALYEVEMLTSELDAAKATALASIDALAPISDDLFCYSQAAIDAAKEAVNAATTVEEVLAVPTPKANAPVAGQAYAIANNTASGNLAVTTGESNSIIVTADAYVYFTAVEGGYVISNNDGEYIYKTTNDNWTFGATTNIEEAYVVTVNVVEGGYTIQGVKGLFGTDSVDDGAIVYANKAAAANGVWTIAPVTIPDAIAGVDANAAATVKKVVRNGRIVVVGNEKTYDVNGALLKK